MANATKESRGELRLIAEIAKRGVAMLKDRFDIDAQVIDCLMDIEHVHGVDRLNLQQFLDFDEGNFAHDFVGIYTHFNRETLQLEGGFWPRCGK